VRFMYSADPSRGSALSVAVIRAAPLSDIDPCHRPFLRNKNRVDGRWGTFPLLRPLPGPLNTIFFGPWDDFYFSTPNPIFTLGASALPVRPLSAFRLRCPVYRFNTLISESQVTSARKFYPNPQCYRVLRRLLSVFSFTVVAFFSNPVRVTHRGPSKT